MNTRGLLVVILTFILGGIWLQLFVEMWKSFSETADELGAIFFGGLLLVICVGMIYAFDTALGSMAVQYVCSTAE